jgi:hypothetical protein
MKIIVELDDDYTPEINDTPVEEIQEALASVGISADVYLFDGEEMYHIYYMDGDDSTLHFLGAKSFPTDTLPEKRKSELMDCFWDPRLDASGCAPVVRKAD